jgi:hypothetical protein
MIGKKICCILILTLLVLSGLVYPLKGNSIITETKENGTSQESFFEITPIASAENDNDIINNEEIIKESSFENINYQEGELEIYDGPDNFHYLGPHEHSIEDNINVELEDWKIPLSNAPTGDDGGVTSPPWYDCGHGTEVLNWFLAPFHSEESSVNCNTGNGYLSLSASCGWSMAIETHAWCWFKGYYDCTQEGFHEIKFKIDYDGLVRAVDIPIKFGLGILEIEANVAYKFGDFQERSELIFLRDSWPDVGDYSIPGPYEPDGPYEKGYPDKMHLDSGYRYYFIVQFNIRLKCAATFFTVSGGSIYLDTWFQEAIISPDVPPIFADFVTSGVVEIDDELYFAIYPEPLYFSPGSTVKLHANVWNDGPDDADCYIAIGLDGDGWADGPFTIPTGGINNGLHFVLENFQWPNDLDVHSIWCFADCYDDIEEINEDNNFGYIEWAAVGPPDLSVDDITLLKYNSNTWPPSGPEDIDWDNPDPFKAGDRVIPMVLISNSGVGPSLNMMIEYYLDNNLEGQSGPYGFAADSWVIFLISDNEEGDPPGIIWPDEECHDIRWEVHDSDYNQHDSLEEEYCPMKTEIQLEPASYNFGTVTIGEHKDHTFTLTNIGDTQATGSVSISGDPDFTIISGGDGFNLAPAETKSIIVRFEPSSTGGKTATLTVNGDPPCNDDSSSLTGTGTKTQCLRFSPSEHNFREVDIGETSGIFTFALQNIIDTTVTGNIYLDGQDSSQFSIIEGGGVFSLEPGDTTIVNMTFNPTSKGSKTAELIADPDLPSCDNTIADLSGTGIEPEDLSLDPKSYEFGTIYVNHESTPASFTLTNNGENTISGNIFLEGSDPTQFEITQGKGPFSLPSGESEFIKVKFCPSSKGSKSATLKVDVNYPYADVTATLSGTGEWEDILSLEPDSHEFPDTKEDKCSESFTFALTNNDNEIKAKVNIYEESDHFEITTGGGGG